MPAVTSSPSSSLSDDDMLASELSASSASSSSSSASSSPTPSAARVTDVRGDPSAAGDDGGLSSSQSSSRLSQLTRLLDQTSLYSRFLSERMPMRYQHSMKLFSSSQDRRRARAAVSTSQQEQAEAVSDERFNSLNRLLAAGRSLFMYQAVGVDWLISMFENGLNGCLADEMGLGKTLQTIVFLAHLHAHGVTGPFLIVAPLSTLQAWEAECNSWCPQLRIVRYHGSVEERRQLRDRIFADRKAVPIVLTSYEIAMNDSQHLRRVRWSYLIVDEAHRIKNLQCRLLLRLQEFNSENRLLLTGTPLQNSLRELWSLLHFLLPAVFDSLSRFERWFDFDDLLREEGGDQLLLQQEKRDRVVSKLHDILHPFVLRRLKVDVLQLPRKTEYLLYTPMLALQADYYSQIMHRRLQQLAHASGGLNMRNVIMQLQKVADCPFLVNRADWMDADDAAADDDDDEETEQQEEEEEKAAPVPSRKRKAAEKAAAAGGRRGRQWTAQAIHQDLLQSCGKLQVVDKVLRCLRSRGEKLLIFSGMTRMLDLLATFVETGGYGSYIRIDGHTPALARGEQVLHFNSSSPSSPTIALLSTRAAGLGLNLAAASTVILYDSDWNPQVDLQAQDRAHRVGSRREVSVLRLLVPASVEMSKYAAAQRKTVLTNVVMPKSKFKGENGWSRAGSRAAAGGERDFLHELQQLFDREQRRLKGEDVQPAVTSATPAGKEDRRKQRKEEEQREAEANVIKGEGRTSRGRKRKAAVQESEDQQEEVEVKHETAAAEVAQLSEADIAALLSHELTAEQVQQHPLIELVDEEEGTVDTEAVERETAEATTDTVEPEDETES